MYTIIRRDVPRPALSRRARAARSPAFPARLRARASELHAEDAEHGEPGGVRFARLGPRLARAGEAVLLRLGIPAGVRPQPEEPCREGARELRARSRARSRVLRGRRDLAAERAPVPVPRAAVGARAQRRACQVRRNEAAPSAA